MKLPILLFLVAMSSLTVSAVETAPAAWPRFQAKVAKEQVNFRVEPSLRARLAPVRPPKGTVISVQRASDEHWFEILDPDEYRGFFVREELVVLGPQEGSPDPLGSGKPGTR